MAVAVQTPHLTIQPLLVEAELQVKVLLVELVSHNLLFAEAAVEVAQER